MDDISFTIPAGQCVGVLGPNGAGKTTTIRMITGYLPPSAGTVRVNDLDTINDSIGARRLMGYLPEATPLFRKCGCRTTSRIALSCMVWDEPRGGRESGPRWSDAG